MFDFFDKIIGFFETIWNVVLNIVDGLITALEVLANMIAFPVVLYPILPAFLVSAVSITIAIGAVKFIIGR